MEIRSTNTGAQHGLPEDWQEGMREMARQITESGALKSVQDGSKVDELLQIQKSLQNTNGPGRVGGAGNAPAIGGVTMSFSAEDLAAALLVLQGKTQESQLKTAKEGLETSRIQSDKANEKALNKILDANKKAEDAEAKAKKMGIFGWIAKIAGFIASIAAVAVAAAATVATGGAAAPLLAFAIVGMVGATMSLASAISQEAGGPPLELGSLLNKAFTEMLVSFGMDREKAEQVGKVMAGAVGLMTGAVLIDPSLAGDLFAGIALLAGADEMQAAIIATAFTVAATIAIAVAQIVLTAGVGTAGAVASVATRIGQITQAAAGITQGVSTAVAGGYGVAKAFDDRDVANLQADRKEIQALLIKLQQKMEEEREEIRKVIEEIMEGYNVVSQMFESAASSRQQITANLGARGSMI